MEDSLSIHLWVFHSRAGAHMEERSESVGR
jgi:hypothetical protein